MNAETTMVTMASPVPTPTCSLISILSLGCRRWGLPGSPVTQKLTSDHREEDSWCKHARIDHNVAMTVLPAVTIDDHEWMRPDYDYTADVNSDSSSPDVRHFDFGLDTPELTNSEDDEDEATLIINLDDGLPARSQSASPDLPDDGIDHSGDSDVENQFAVETVTSGEDVSATTDAVYGSLGQLKLLEAREAETRGHRPTQGELEGDPYERVESQLSLEPCVGHRIDAPGPRDDADVTPVIILRSQDGDDVSKVLDQVDEEDDKDEEEEEEDRSLRRLARSTSLKTGKTPPGTPGQKKIVRFADALGLDLALVRTFLDDIPTVPPSAFSHLSGLTDSGTSLNYGAPPPQHRWRRSETSSSSTTTSTGLSLVASFSQPDTMPDLIERVKSDRVCLESATMAIDELLMIRGSVRVLNVDFHKTVLVRLTTDEWRSHSDVACAYVVGSCDGLTDRFRFSLTAGQQLQPGQRLSFAICYYAAGKEFWDNNRGANYTFQCVATGNAQHHFSSLAWSTPSDCFFPYLL